MKYLFSMIIFLSFSAMAVTETENPFNNGHNTPPKKSVTKPKKAKTAKKADSCSNLPTRCADIADCADAQRALRCGMTRLDRDHDGTACDAQCQ